MCPVVSNGGTFLCRLFWDGELGPEVTQYASSAKKNAARGIMRERLASIETLCLYCSFLSFGGVIILSCSNTMNYVGFRKYSSSSFLYDGQLSYEILRCDQPLTPRMS